MGPPKVRETALQLKGARPDFAEAATRFRPDEEYEGTAPRVSWAYEPAGAVSAAVADPTASCISGRRKQRIRKSKPSTGVEPATY
jgi:hypothetical protein